MKIIKSDDYDREIFNEEVIATNVNEIYADMIVDMLNKKAEKSYEFYLRGFVFRLEDNDYKLMELADIYGCK